MADAKKVTKMAPSSSVFPVCTSDDDENTKPHVLLQVAVDGTDKNTKQPPSPMPAVNNKKKIRSGSSLACVLALCSALILGLSAGIALITSPCDPAKPSWWASCIELTDAAGAKVEALERRQLWVSGVQAAAALLGLLLCGQRRLRWALGFVALAVGVVNLYMIAVIGNIFTAADPGDHSLKIDHFAVIVLFALVYLLGFIALLVPGQEQDDDE